MVKQKLKGDFVLMAKKVLTPEEYKDKMSKKAEKRKRFGKSFLTALAYALACVIVYSMVTIAFTKNATPVISTSGNNTSVNTGTDTNNNGSDNSGNTDNAGADNTDANAGDNTDANAGDNTDNSGDNKSQGGVASGAISASSSTAEIVNYFNKAINNVKPSAKKVTLNYEKNSEAGGIEGNLPKSLTSIANSLIASNMGEKDLSKLDPAMVNATTTAQKNAMFPVENESWSSKLTADDVQKAEVKDNGSTYTITLYIKADEPSTNTAHGQGHNGKVFSVIMPSIVTDNAGPAANIIKEVKTGHKDGKVTVTVDKATGNVTAANYYFVWTLSLKALGAELSIPFGLEKQFTIAW